MRYHSEEERRKWQDPESILEGIGMREGMAFADIGCGDGFFTLPAARIAGVSGRVFGVDTDRDALGGLREKAGAEGLENIELAEAEGESTLQCEACMDIVFLGIVLHDFREPAEVLANARKMLKPAGLLANLDWKKEPMELGPPPGIRFDEDKAAGLIEGAGFRIESVGDSGRYHYIITARPVVNG